MQSKILSHRRRERRGRRANTPGSPLYYQPTLFETNAPHFDEKKTRVKGKIFVLDHDANRNGKIDIEDLEWKYLKGDGDFRSDEVKRLRDESDIIVTNPPFSLFREFLAWIVEGKKDFLIIGNMNAIIYKEVFPLIMANKLWLGASIHSGDREFGVPDGYPLQAAGWRIDDAGRKYIRVKGVRWFTTLDHGRRHEPLQLMTEAENVKHSHHKEVCDVGYRQYDNYDAIEVPFTDAIPSDYDGVMGVPISFLDKYCPEQLEIIDSRGCTTIAKLKAKGTPLVKDADGAINGKPTYARILIRRKVDPVFIKNGSRRRQGRLPRPSEAAGNDKAQRAGIAADGDGHPDGCRMARMEEETK